MADQEFDFTTTKVVAPRYNNVSESMLAKVGADDPRRAELEKDAALYAREWVGQALEANPWVGKPGDPNFEAINKLMVERRLPFEDAAKAVVNERKIQQYERRLAEAAKGEDDPRRAAQDAMRRPGGAPAAADGDAAFRKRVLDGYDAAVKADVGASVRHEVWFGDILGRETFDAPDGSAADIEGGKRGLKAHEILLQERGVRLLPEEAIQNIRARVR